MYIYAEDKISGKIIELINICVNFEFGRVISMNQNGKTPKLVHRYILSMVKYS